MERENIVFFNDFDDEKANFSLGKRVKTKNYPIFQIKSARLGNVPEQGGSKETDGDKRPKKGKILEKIGVFK